MGKPGLHLPSFGVIGVEGLPGSGKSAYLVLRVTEIITQDARPVYTNLPIRWRVMRQWLKNRGGTLYANLIHELTRDHFLRFCRRQWLRSEHRKAAEHLRGSRISTAKLDADFVAQHGPDVPDEATQRQLGPDPMTGQLRPLNWIPGGAVIMIDEVHQWFRQEDQKTEDPHLMRYITMHRHHMHEVWWATQAKMQVSLTFRRNTAKFWQVRDIREDTVAWGIRWKHLLVRGSGYVCWTGDQLESRAPESKPIENFVRFWWLPQYKVIFRLYSSFTHVGSAESIRAQLREARLHAGLLPDPSNGVQVEAEPMPIRLNRLVRRWGLRLALVGLIGGLGAALGAAMVPPAVAESQVIETGPTAAPVPEPIVFGAWQGVGNGWARLEGRRVRVGEPIANGRGLLAHVSTRPRVLVVVADDLVYRWEWGESAPRRLGTVEELNNAWLRARDGASDSR